MSGSEPTASEATGATIAPGDWLLCQWWSRRSDHRLIHDEDLEIAVAIDLPFRVMRCDSRDERYLRISCGDRALRVSVGAFLVPVPAPLYPYGALVLPSDAGAAPARVAEILWHQSRAEHMYFLADDSGGATGRRYWEAELTAAAGS